MKTKGWQKIFSFTFVQYVKTKSFIIGTIVMCLIVALLGVGANILPGLLSDEEEITGDSGEMNAVSPNAVYIYDTAEILIDEDFSALTAAGVKVAETALPADEMLKALETAANEAMLSIAPETDPASGAIYGYSVKCYYSPDAEDDAVDYITSMTAELVNYRNLLNSGVTPESYAASQRRVTTYKITAGSDEWNIIESALNYFVPIFASLILFILIFSYGQTVAQSIATEKTSRVMELLLTSVRPLAVVIGKVLAMGLVSLSQFLLIVIVGVVSTMATAPFGIVGEIQEMMETDISMLPAESAAIVEAVENTLGNISPLTIILILVMFILGFVFFALIAALVGASVSRMEDLAAAMQPYSILGVVGMYLAYFPVIGNLDSLETGEATVNPVQIFSYYFPLSSPFALPSALMLGTISIGEVLIATAILAVFVVLVAILVAKIYEMIILHNGNRIKFGDMIKMATRK